VTAYVDTDVIIRLVTGDDLTKQASARALFREAEEGRLTLAAPDTVIADAVFVLSSPRTYALPRPQVGAILSTIVQIPHVHVSNKRVVLRALTLFGSTNVDFGDAMLVASMETDRVTDLYSFDRDFDRFPQVNRIEPST
jgi:predicted nucleic acid-binding protein